VAVKAKIVTAIDIFFMLTFMLTLPPRQNSPKRVLRPLLLGMRP
jgi:hypothetical protein